MQKEQVVAKVVLDNVSKTFRVRGGVVHAVVDLSLTADEGEFLVIVGPSGCGKSTTLRLVAGLEAPNAGAIFIGDREVTRVAPRDRDVAMVFQDYALYPHMTVYQNMAFGLKMRKMPRAPLDRQVRETAELLGLTDLLDRRPGQLSGGQQQRVAVGRAIARRPNVFLFDEPLSNLDAKQRLVLRAEIKALHRRLPTTVLYVTHDQQEAMSLGERIVVMNGGRAHQVAAPQGVYESPSDRFVGELIGSPTINLIHGRLDASGDGVDFDGDFGRWVLPDGSAEALKGWGDRAVQLGVRAEHVRLCGTGDSGLVGVVGEVGVARVQVRLVESLGACRHVHVEADGGATLVVCVGSETPVAEGERVTIAVDLSRAHVFAGDAGGSRLV